MSANTDAIIWGCSSCAFTKDAEERVYEQMQDDIYNKIQCFESQIINCGCLDEYTCYHNSELHLQISQQYISLDLNEVHFMTLTFLCDRHRSLVHELVEDEMPNVSAISLCCSEGCDVHCAVEWD
jgi:tRNA A37 methylthiotransferase MiaB